MNKISLLKDNKFPTSSTIEIVETKLIKLQGILTSGIRTKTSTNAPYYCFFRSDTNNKHSLAECIKSKCKDCEIPVIFRIKKVTASTLTNYLKNPTNSELKEEIIKPNLDKNQSVILTGNWAIPTKSSRPSFTVYSYQKIND